MTDGLDLPELSSVIALLYRADWTRLSLAGQVRGCDEALSLGVLRTGTVRTMPSPGSPPAATREPDAVTVRVAPGGRYRRDDALLSAGSDGTRAWQTGGGSEAGGGGPPYATLLCPSWLLTGYSLTVEERVTACGREAVRVTGNARVGGRGVPVEPRFPGRSALGSPYRWVEAVIDAELGILLRCELADDTGGDPGGGDLAGGDPAGGDPDRWLAEFASLELDPGTDDAVFAPPPGSQSWDAVSGGPDPASALAFLATYFPWLTSPPSAGSRFLARRRGGRAGFLRAGSGGAEGGEPMPDDGPPFGPGGGSERTSVSEDVLALLYRSGARVPRFTATAHFWANGAGIIAGVPDSARPRGEAGELSDALARKADTTTYQESRVRIDGWHRYRIEGVPGPARASSVASVAGAAGAAGPLVRACNEERYWEVRADRVSIDGPRPAPPELADFADTSWLLGCELWGGLPVTVNGRAAYRLSVRGRHAQSELLTLGLPAVAAVDAETGRLLWLTCYGRGKPALRWELRDVAEADPESSSDARDGDFEFTVPTGLRIVRVGTGDDRPAQSSPSSRSSSRSSRSMLGMRERSGR